MNNSTKPILIASAFVIACLALIQCKSNTRKKGKTIHYVVQVSQDESSSIPMKELVNQSLTLIKNRLTASEFRSSVTQAGPDLIDILVSVDSSDMPLMRQILEASNKLEFREVYNISELGQSLFCADKIVAGDPPIDTTATHHFSSPGDQAASKHLSYLIAFSVEANGRTVDNGMIGRSMVADTGTVTKLLNEPDVRKCFPEDIEFCYGLAETTGGSSDNKSYCALYGIKTNMQKSLLTNENIRSAEADYGSDGKPELYFQLNQTGARIFENMTQANKGRFIAIILDKKVISAPHVESEVAGGNVSIHGNFTTAETNMLAHQLNAGYLPARLRIVLQEIVKEKP